MDPQSQPFTLSYSTASSNHNNSSSENWRLQNDVARLHHIQAEHNDRIARLERRQDDDARMKSVWGNQSPFPSVLSGTPQHGPVQHSSSDRFADFDEETNNMMSSLHLDAENEPRRGMGAASRANSVRFDESANQNYVSHSSRPSVDFFSRTSSGLGGLQMSERTSSHKSEGRASSAHSMRSAASGRANSLNMDTAAFGFSDTVCTGSFKSFLDLRLIQKLGFEPEIRHHEDGYRTVQLPVFFPEAVPHPASSRSSSPAPQLPSLIVEFRVVERPGAEDEDKAIQIFLGSDVLRAHNADILFSSNTMTLYDDERNKLSIPLSRPESEAAFNGLFVTSGWSLSGPQPARAEESTRGRLHLNGLGQGSSAVSVSSAAASPPPGKYRPPGAVAAEVLNTGSAKPGTPGSDCDNRPPSRQSNVSRPSLTMLNTKSDRSEPDETPTESGAQTTPLRSGNGPATWGTWRRDGAASATMQSSGLDWANAGKSREVYQRKDTGIKVLKPKTSSRAFSTSATPTSASGVASPADGKSRFFDEGRQRSGPDSQAPKAETTPKENVAPSSTTPASTAAAPKMKSNPIGGASAFSWLNPGASK